jgi:signal transduction histidine kinase
VTSRFSFPRTLKFQITGALLLILVLFGLALHFTSKALKEQGHSNVLLSLAGKLQLTSEQLAIQGMNYKENAPRDPATYRRDLRLYYQDLMAHVMTFDRISASFMHGTFGPELTGFDRMVRPTLSPDTLRAVDRLQAVWKAYRAGLGRALGPDEAEPRLEKGADFVIAEHASLNRATDGLMRAYQAQVAEQLQLINWINAGAWLGAVLITLGILLWFFLRVLRPLDRAVLGFRQVAQGDFGHQVESSGDHEIAWLTDSFNRLSRRLYACFRLIDRIQQGSDLNDTLRFVAEEFPALLPLDWVGVLFVTGNGASIKLERAYVDGHPQVIPNAHFSLEGTLLQRAMASGEPLHIPDVSQTAGADPRYRFLSLLSASGAKDAIFLPVTEQSPLPGVLVFASRRPHTYSRDHLELLANIAGLVTHSFGRTLRLAEHARLAAIGQFASGIAHEVRSPLTTITLALDYFCKADLPGSAGKRALLARQEADRVARLVEEMLVYAKPLRLDLHELDLTGLVADFIQTHADLATPRSQTLELSDGAQHGSILGDRDRLLQVLINLTQNACEAAPEGSRIALRLSQQTELGTLTLRVENPGPPIPPEALSRLTEPFFTTKADGTGLGLAIVKRLVDAHGGELNISSDPQGTRFQVTLPLAG